jgi:DNA-binding NarL/FixJ family response regulator
MTSRNVHEAAAPPKGIRMSRSFESLDADLAPLRILCVDDNPLVVEALALRLGLVGGFEWLSPIDDAGQLIIEVDRQRPDIVLLDLDMPGRDPIDALEELVETGRLARVLIFSGHTRADLIERAIDAGAWGSVSKHSDVGLIVAAIRHIARGAFLLDATAGDRSAIAAPNDGGAPAKAETTPRE